jgi:hypothetical protein
MEVRVDGNRSSSESWLESHRIPVQELPGISEEEQRVAEKLAISAEDYRRSKYAAELTKKQLDLRAVKVGQLVESWLRNHHVKAAIKAVWLKTFEGKYRIDVDVDGVVQLVVITEDLMDEILDTGSQEAQRSFDRALTANFGLREVAQAS